MRKIAMTLGLFLLLCTFFAERASAVDVTAAQRETFGVDALEQQVPDGAADVLDGLTVTDSLDLEKGLHRLGDALPQIAGDALRQGLQSGAALIAISALCAIASAVTDGESVGMTISLVGVAAICALSVGNVKTFLGLGCGVLDSMETFSKILLPTLTTAAVAGGAVTSAAAKYAATALFVDVLLTAGRNLVVPMIFAYLAAAMGGIAFSSTGLAKVAKLLQWAAGILLTVLVTAFVLYLSLSGVITATADATAAKLTKTVISTVLPVVGGIVSDAASSVVAGANVLKNAVGVFGLLVVCGACLAPFLQLGIHFLLYKGISVLSQTLAGETVSKMIDAVGNSFGMLLGLIGSVAIMLFISVISLLKVVTG